MKRPANKKTVRKKPARKLAGDAKHELQNGATLAERIVTAPYLIEAKAARARLSEWLADLPATQAQPLNALLAAHPTLGTLLQSLAESSPYLWELVSGDAARLLRLLTCDPDQHLATLLADNGRAVTLTTDEAEAMRLLRHMKAEAALLIALADIGGVWPVMRATRALTDLADSAVDAEVLVDPRPAGQDLRLHAHGTGRAGTDEGASRGQQGASGEGHRGPRGRRLRATSSRHAVPRSLSFVRWE